MDTSAESEPVVLAETLTPLAERVQEGVPKSEDALASAVGRANPIDVARALSDVSDSCVGTIFDALGTDEQATVLSESDPVIQAQLLMHVGERRASLVSSLEPDDAADLLETLDAADRESLLGELPRAEAADIRHLSRWAPDTAGGLMTTEFVEVHPDDTVDAVLDVLRKADEAELITIIYVTLERKLAGVFSIRDLLKQPHAARVRDFMTKEVMTVGPEADQEEVLRRMETYHLAALPVLDQRGAMLGIVSFDDALTAMEEEGSEDVMTMAGAPSIATRRLTIPQRVLARLPWLLVTLGGGLTSALVIRALGHGGEVGAVGYFLPLVGGMGGSVAMQSAAIMVRGFATGEVDARRIRQTVLEETMVGFLVGIVCGFGAALIAFLIQGDPMIALSVGASLMLATSVAAGAGTLIPALCERMGIDPAFSAGPFLSALNDIMGFTIYMTVAWMLVSKIAT